MRPEYTSEPVIITPTLNDCMDEGPAAFCPCTALLPLKSVLPRDQRHNAHGGQPGPRLHRIVVGKGGDGDVPNAVDFFLKCCINPNMPRCQGSAAPCPLTGRCSGRLPQGPWPPCAGQHPPQALRPHDPPTQRRCACPDPEMRECPLFVITWPRLNAALLEAVTHGGDVMTKRLADGVFNLQLFSYHKPLQFCSCWQWTAAGGHQGHHVTANHAAKHCISLTTP